jgi:hypothetical protein
MPCASPQSAADRSGRPRIERGNFAQSAIILGRPLRPAPHSATLSGAGLDRAPGPGRRPPSWWSPSPGYRCPAGPAAAASRRRTWCPSILGPGLAHRRRRGRQPGPRPGAALAQLRPAGERRLPDERCDADPGKSGPALRGDARLAPHQGGRSEGGEENRCWARATPVGARPVGEGGRAHQGAEAPGAARRQGAGAGVRERRRAGEAGIRG